MVDYQTSHPSANPVAGIKPAPAVAPCEDRLEAIREDADRLRLDASYFGDRVATLLSDLTELFEDHQANSPLGVALDAAVDAVTWVSNAVENITGEFDSLSDHLDDAAQSLNTDTD